MKFFSTQIKKRFLSISTINLRFSYGKKDILKNLNLELKEKKIIAIVGKSGSGKSTFLKLVAKLIKKKYYGKINLFNKNFLFSKKSIGYVPQEISLIPDLSVIENIKIIGNNFGVKNDLALKRAEKLLTFLDLEDLDFKQSVSTLSGGQKVRLNIVVSILHNPRLIILDEPFNAIDFKSRRVLWHFLKFLKSKKKTIVLTSHLLTETKEFVDEYVILKDGKIFFKGEIKELKKKIGVSKILEMKIKLDSQKFREIKKYCDYLDIKILDNYIDYIMFALKFENQKKNLESFLTKNRINFSIIDLREPNLDEIFLVD